MNQILTHWLNGRSIEWIAIKLSMTNEQVTDSIRKNWGDL